MKNKQRGVVEAWGEARAEAAAKAWEVDVAEAGAVGKEEAEAPKAVAVPHVFVESGRRDLPRSVFFRRLPENLTAPPFHPLGHGAAVLPFSVGTWI